MTPQELKNSILQLAIQGKLVEQRPEEGTAEALYQQIQAEKQALIKAGKLKKEKPLPEITEDEKPFEIPESWKWVHLNQIAESGLGKTLDKAKNTGAFVPYLCSINVYWTGVSLDKVKEAKFSDDDRIKYRLQKGDLLICEGGDVGRCAIWNSNEEMYYQNALHRVRVYGRLFPQYFQMVIQCYKGIGIIDEFSKGMTIKHLVQNSLYAMWLPLPPLAEQNRIVAKIEELLPLIDRYEQAWNQLEDLNKRFPMDLQKSILQLAIQGKLVPQRPEEGTGEELYQQIQAEKQTLIKAGKLKKEKPLPAITEDEKPFEIPESWKWVRLCQVGITQTGNTPSKTHPEYLGTEIPFVSPGDIQNNKIFYGKQSLSLLGKQVARVGSAGTILQVCIGGSIGKAAITDREVTYNQQINAITPIMINSDYLLSVMTSHYFVNSMKEKAGGTATPIINRGLWDSLLIPLPPINEQKRIIHRLVFAIKLIMI